MSLLISYIKRSHYEYDTIISKSTEKDETTNCILKTVCLKKAGKLYTALLNFLSRMTHISYKIHGFIKHHKQDPTT